MVKSIRWHTNKPKKNLSTISFIFSIKLWEAPLVVLSANKAWIQKRLPLLFFFLFFFFLMPLAYLQPIQWQNINAIFSMLKQFPLFALLFFLNVFFQTVLNGVGTIATEENCPPVEVRVWIRVRVGTNFSLGQLS